jgi:hypothetical protein
MLEGTCVGARWCFDEQTLHVEVIHLFACGPLPQDDFSGSQRSSRKEASLSLKKLLSLQLQPLPRGNSRGTSSVLCYEEYNIFGWV